MTLPARIPTANKTQSRAANGVPRKFLAEVALPFVGDCCVEWPFARSNGYGNVWIDGKFWIVSRYVCEQTNGAAQKGQAAAHTCGNRACVNPGHIRWASNAENCADKVLHGRDTRGERHRDNKLTEQQARAILASGKSWAKLASEYGVTKSAIQGIKTGKNWKHLHAAT